MHRAKRNYVPNSFTASFYIFNFTMIYDHTSYDIPYTNILYYNANVVLSIGYNICVFVNCIFVSVCLVLIRSYNYTLTRCDTE